MEKIKFRSAHYLHEDNTFSHFSYWGLINHKNEFDNTCFSSPSSSSKSYRKFEEQFTGLKDKNGKDIYEGDIVKKAWLSQSFTKDRLRFAIGFVEFGKYLVLEDSFGVDYFANGWFMEFDDKSGKIEINEKFEVIGNIHENIDLLI